jgi:hypothetical protein
MMGIEESIFKDLSRVIISVEVHIESKVILYSMANIREI